MTRPFLIDTFLLSSVLTAGLMLPSQAQDISELFDPAALSRSICRGPAADGKTNAFAQLAAATTSAAPSARPPLWQGLGDLTYKVTTTQPLAQQYFDQGLRLLYAFNHAEAIRAFKAGQEIDPKCAMCFWGEALALGPNINLAMQPDAQAPALAALKKAQTLKTAASVKEQALIDALAARYSADETVERATLNQNFAKAMRDVQRQYPDDSEIALLTVEAAMDVAPWDYWQPGGREPTEAMAEAYPIIENVLARDPKHPGAIHFYIHVMEQSAWPEKSVPHAERLAALMPSAGHIVHMPSHTYFRVGRYKDSLNSNIAAVAADEAFFAQAASDPIYRTGYYPHNIHFAIESAAMAGDGKTALEMAVKLDAAIPAPALRAVPMAQPIAIASYLARLRFSALNDVLALPDVGDDLPYMKGMWRYVRGSASAKQGNIAAANRELDGLVALLRTEDFSAIEDAAVPAREILAVAENVLRARIAGANGDWNAAVTALEQAVKDQDALPYTEPAYWYYPARQSLGAALLKAGRAKEAVEVLRRSLIDAPNNGWALYALTAASAAAGDKVAAAEYEKLFKKAWVGATPPALEHI